MARVAVPRLRLVVHLFPCDRSSTSNSTTNISEIPQRKYHSTTRYYHSHRLDSWSHGPSSASRFWLVASQKFRQNPVLDTVTEATPMGNSLDHLQKNSFYPGSMTVACWYRSSRLGCGFLFWEWEVWRHWEVTKNVLMLAESSLSPSIPAKFTFTS